MVIFCLIQRFLILNSYYKSRMAVFRSRLVIMISHDSFSFSYSNFNFSYSDFRISSSDFPISHSDFSILHINYWNSIGDFELLPVLSCLGCHRDGAVVRALASHQCGPGSIPRSSVHCGLSFFGSLLCTERFSPGTLVSLLLKNQNLTW